MEYKKLIIKGKSDPEPIEINEEDLVEIERDEITGKVSLGKEGNHLDIRAAGDFCNKAIYLPQQFDYVIGIDNFGCKILIVKKGKE